LSSRLVQVNRVEQPEQIAEASARLRVELHSRAVSTSQLLDIFHRWSKGILESEARHVPGAVFLSLWLRRNTLEPLLTRELGQLDGTWSTEGKTQFQSFPIGVVGHWPAGNVEVLPFLSLTCSLLGGNAGLVRVPSGLVEITQALAKPLETADPEGIVASRTELFTFPHTELPLQNAMASSVDGAMIWGGQEAVLTVRSLPFPHWARIQVFGPRISIAMMDRSSWSDAGARKKWCTRLARDVWQFEQRACSSPQVLFAEQSEPADIAQLCGDLVEAFSEENRVHSRTSIEPYLTSRIVQARASCLLEDARNRAWFPETPDWTLLLQHRSEIPLPTQGKTLTVIPVPDLGDAVSLLDGNVQTLGLAMGDPSKERQVAERAARLGVDRIVRMGTMHAFDSPWDGTELIRPLTRRVRYSPTANF
jgi:acyl-CoA reductase LuxC